MYQKSRLRTFNTSNKLSTPMHMCMPRSSICWWYSCFCFVCFGARKYIQLAMLDFTQHDTQLKKLLWTNTFSELPNYFSIPAVLLQDVFWWAFQYFPLPFHLSTYNLHAYTQTCTILSILITLRAGYEEWGASKLQVLSNYNAHPCKLGPISVVRP
jgi:hypothetical protein